ncbi:MAG: hypothetical protein K0R71_358 [Bacillales bacterium]|jgi:hypothetical protein|nr:hypothetical protein [Bacillales bacterium]
MKKLLILISIIITTQFLFGCSFNKSVQYKEFDYGIAGFSENNEKLMPVPQDGVLMTTTEEFQKFEDKYFTPITSRDIPIKTHNKEKAVLYLQFPSINDKVYEYEVTSLFVKNNTLTVNVKKIGISKCAIRREVVNGQLKWILFIEVDKTNLKKNMKIVINK